MSYKGNVYDSDLINHIKSVCQDRMGDGSCLTYDALTEVLFGPFGTDKAGAKIRENRTTLLRLINQEVLVPEEFTCIVGGPAGGIGLFGVSHSKGGGGNAIKPSEELVALVSSELTRILKVNGNKGVSNSALTGMVCGRHADQLTAMNLDPEDLAKMSSLVSAAAAYSNKFEQKKAIGWVFRAA